VKCPHHREAMLTKWIESIGVESEFHSNPPSHLLGCFVRERDTEYRTRIDMSGVDHRNNSFGDGMSLAWTSSSIDQEWSVDSVYGDLLLRIEHGRQYSKKGEKVEPKLDKKRDRFPTWSLDDFFLQFFFFPIYSGLNILLVLLSLDLVKLFGSRSRVKLLEKLVIEDVVARSNTGFFIRELCRDVDEQINAVRRELMNLEALGILKSYEQNKKKYYQMNHNCPIYPDLIEMFLKSYDVMKPVKEFFKWRKTLDLVTISDAVLNFRNETTNNIVDIFIIGDLDKIEFNNFLEKTFYGKKVKYAIMTIDDFSHRLEYDDKLVLSILAQKGNIFLRDRLEIEGTIEAKLRAKKIFK
jgi:hypothetical protein